MITYAQWRAERDNLKRLKSAVDSLSRDIVHARVKNQAELEQRIQRLRALCQELFPDKMDLFEMIYVSRFQRLWHQFGLSSPSSCREF